MVKALEALKEIQDITFKSKECFGYEANFRFNDAYISRLNEAIKELEELKNRSCINCRFFSLEYENIGICPFLTCPKVDYYVDKDFCCNKWESKE